MKKATYIGATGVIFNTKTGDWVVIPREEVEVRVARRTMYGYLHYLVEAPKYGVAGYLYYNYSDAVDEFVRSYDFRVVSDSTFYKYRRAYNLDRLGRCDGLK